MIYPANLLITNHCNQNCPFCFASREMKSSALAKEMSLESYKKVLRKIKRSGSYSSIKMLGGEPTLHSKLFTLIDLAVADGLSVQIFTNGVMKNETATRLASYGSKIGYTFNCTTPGFQHNKRLREEVISCMKELHKKSTITTSVTVDPFLRVDALVGTLSGVAPILDSIRIGFSNPIANNRNWYTFADFPKMGPLLAGFIREIRTGGFAGTFSLNCGFTRCMFTESEYRYVKSETQNIKWSCFGKESSMDIGVDMSAFHCFPLSDMKRIALNDTSYRSANRELIASRMKQWATLKENVCLKCPFYGFGGDKCPGPCIAFRTNERIK